MYGGLSTPPAFSLLCTQYDTTSNIISRERMWLYAPVVNQTEIYPIPTSAFVMIKIKIDEPHTDGKYK